MDAKRRLIPILLVASFGTTTFAQSEHSFGEAFFVSRSSDGSIELIGSGDSEVRTVFNNVKNEIRVESC